MLLTICLITYNHANYIARAIEGVLEQQTDFEWNLLIADDCSTDGTKEIIKSYKLQHPNKINILLQEKNIGAASNWLELITTPKSKYIAYFEGDDYWTDPNKLQQQVNFLEANPNFSICFTDYCILKQGNEELKTSNIYNNLKTRNEFGLHDVIRNNFIPTLTVMYRNSFHEFPSNFRNLFPGDWPLHILNAQYGKIKFLPIVTAVYRLHGDGVCSSSKPIENYKKYLKSLVLIQEWFKDADFSLKIAFLIAKINIYKDILKYYVKIIIFKWVK